MSIREDKQSRPCLLQTEPLLRFPRGIEECGGGGGGSSFPAQRMNYFISFNTKIFFSVKIVSSETLSNLCLLLGIQNIKNIRYE